jgi:hypothetical protein
MMAWMRSQVLRNLLIDKAKKVDEMLFGASGIAPGPARFGGFPQDGVDVAFGSAAIIDLMFCTFGWKSVDFYRLLACIAFWWRPVPSHQFQGSCYWLGALS